MKYILFVFFLGAPGPYSEYGMFDSLAECDASRKQLSVTLTAYNAKAEKAEQVQYFSVACAPLVSAPKGADV